MSVATLAAENANEATVTPVASSGKVPILREPGAWSQAVGFLLVRFGRNLNSVTVKIFSYLMYSVKKLSKFCTSLRFAKIMLQ